MAARKTPSVPALERGLAVLEVVAQSRSGLTFSQIARQLPYPKSSVHCLLLTFERTGYLWRSEATGRYMCGPKLTHIANSAMQGVVLREKAAPLLRALLDRTNLTVHMAILESGTAVLIAKVERIGSRRVSTWVGKRIDVHCTSLGKCLIAYISEAELVSIVQQHGLLRHNENTICSLPRLKQELATIRQRGWAMDDEEEEIGIRCIGAPVLDADGNAVAAISVSGTTGDIHLGTADSLAQEVRQTALELSRELGSYGQLAFHLQSQSAAAGGG